MTFLGHPGYCIKYQRCWFYDYLISMATSSTQYPLMAALAVLLIHCNITMWDYHHSLIAILYISLIEQEYKMVYFLC